MPENGYADRATDALKRLTAEQLRDWGDSAVDIAAGLGDEVVVLGISAGGVVAAWCGQNRPEVGARSWSRRCSASRTSGPAQRRDDAITLFLPDVSIWKDPVLRARLRGLPHGYKRQSSRATGEILRLAHASARQAEAARRRPARLRSSSTRTTPRSTTAWRPARRRLGAVTGWRSARYEFARRHGLGHELVDPMEPGADPALTYPVLSG